MPKNGCELAKINLRLDRCKKIMMGLIQQFEILETMTSLVFLSFRDSIFPASGFQSLQFRLIEQILGIDLSHVQGCPHYRLNDADFACLQQARHQTTLSQSLMHMLANLPYTKAELPDFWAEYANQVVAGFMFEKDIIQKNLNLSPSEKTAQLGQIDENLNRFADWFHASPTETTRAGFVCLYIFLHHETDQLAPLHQLLRNIMDIDEALCLWRFHHYMMVQRMIGHKIGTGGSLGQAYLKKHLDSQRIFIFLLDIISYFLPPLQIPKN